MQTISPTTPLSMVIVDPATKRISHAVNSPYEERFRTSREMVRDLFEHKVRSILAPLPPSLPSILTAAPPTGHPIR